MQVELHINGNLQLVLTPENEIERVVLEQMLLGAGRGKAVKLRAGAQPKPDKTEEKYVVEVEG